VVNLRLFLGVLLQELKLVHVQLAALGGMLVNSLVAN
jgi:hypothetical protein